MASKLQSRDPDKTFRGEIKRKKNDERGEKYSIFRQVLTGSEIPQG